MALTARTWVEGEVGSAPKLNTLRDDVLDRYNNGGLLHSFFRLQAPISPGQISGTVDNWNPTGLSTANVIRMSGASGTDLTGLVAQPAGTMILALNVGSFAITLHHQNAGSSAANRFISPTAANLTWNTGVMYFFHYDATSARWWVGLL